MATYMPHSHSPRMPERAIPQTLAQYAAPITPVHSPHHSITSSVSSRTPLHTLSIHEYRKQQNTPSAQTATPTGKTLRRKAAAPALHGLERAPSVASAIRGVPQSSYRSLQPSQSAQHLQSHRSPFLSQPFSDQLFRSQSAEPRTQGGSVSSISTTSTGKVRHFNSRKRLPKPLINPGFATLPPHLANTRTEYPQRRPPFPAALDYLAEGSNSSEARTTSTFSLSRFPQPPQQNDHSPHHPKHEQDYTRVTATSYASIVPATPPATPATIHYRGTSFDLVNPHDSLLLHDIVTPSKDFGSNEYLAVPTSDEHIFDSAEMAPKRALYGDLSAAHAGIFRRADGSFSSSNLDLPLPPTPAAISPNSSTYTSPVYSPESDLAPPPLALSKVPSESRFSLKQLTRTLTKRLGRTPEAERGQELCELGDPQLHLSHSTEAQYSRPLQETDVATPQSAYFPVSPTSPFTPTSPQPIEEQYHERYEDDEIEIARRQPVQRYGSEPLASLIPDDYSTQNGRAEAVRTSMSDGHLLSRPYYDDLDSIYPSSSVYTADGQRVSNYQQSLASNTRQSNPFVRFSGTDASNFANEYTQDSLYGYSARGSRKSKPLSREVFRSSATQEKTDTISKIIDQYDPNAIANNTMSVQSTDDSSSRDMPGSAVRPDSPKTHPNDTRVTSGFSAFEFDLYLDSVRAQKQDSNKLDEHAPARRPTVVTRDLGSPPRAPAPLAPPVTSVWIPFGLPQPESSEMFSSQSSQSYGDTQNLLQIPESDTLVRPPVLGQPLEPSSSYSQPEAKSLEGSSSYLEVDALPSPHTPREALDEADRIFQNATSDAPLAAKGIPAMWARRSSGNMLLGRRTNSQSLAETGDTNFPTLGRESSIGVTEAEWESVGGRSHGFRDSFGSIADYSSSEGTRHSMGLDSNGSIPSWQNHSQGPSIYSHPSPIHPHLHPFSSSPPQLRPEGRDQDLSSPPLDSSPPVSRNVPVFRPMANHEAAHERGLYQPPRSNAPWVNPYAFSDKETQDLLASGPNENIIFSDEGRRDDSSGDGYFQQQVDAVMPTSSSSVNAFDGARGIERENTFEKLCMIGPRGNLTGTPQGTGMYETGSSIANTSSPGETLTSSIARRSHRSTEYPGFYASPFPATGSITKIVQSPPREEPDYERTPSQITLFPRSSELEPVIETSPNAGASHRRSLRNTTTFQRAQRRASRTAAVPGQTKLRQMILAPEHARKTLSSADTQFSHFLGGSERPSTSDTNTPLHPQLSVVTLPLARANIAHEHSPHLLCPERVPNAEDEERRRRLSWAILAVFCLLPPCIILYRVWGDSIMISVTEGHLGYCTNKSKKAALIVGITVNIGIATAIVVPIVIAHALGAA